MEHLTTLFARKRFKAAALTLAALMVSGCGGGGSLTQGNFLFAPQGGPVQPESDIQFDYPAGAVSQGVSVSAAPRTVTTSPDANNKTPSPPLSQAVMITLTGVANSGTPANTINFSGRPAIITLSYNAAPASNTTSALGTLPPRIYVQKQGQTTWSVLPAPVSSDITVSNPPAGTTLSAEVTLLETGDTFAVFAPSTPTDAFSPA